VRINHPEWSKNATIYQINTRQFTQEGTFVAAEAHLPRLEDLGAVILWLMPVQVIGEKNRKGTLGSPYAVKDYYAVEPSLGTMDDLRHFVNAAHDLGMYVILDWVANHTAWDSNLVTEHPEWYSRDWKGDFQPTPWWDWVDIIDLDYDNAELREYMTNAMKFWVSESDVDGYRCDTAGFVPTDFWSTVRLKRANTALWNAHWGARMINVPTTADTAVFSFVRRNDQDKIFAVFNFSPDQQSVSFAETLCHGEYVDHFSNRTVSVDGSTNLTLAPWAYRVLVRPH
jgi:glycosidase